MDVSISALPIETACSFETSTSRTKDYNLNNTRRETLKHKSNVDIELQVLRAATVNSTGMWHPVAWDKFIDVSEESTASISVVEQWAK
jgi:hypothetical protein